MNKVKDCKQMDEEYIHTVYPYFLQYRKKKGYSTADGLDLIMLWYEFLHLLKEELDKKLQEGGQSADTNGKNHVTNAKRTRHIL